MAIRFIGLLLAILGFLRSEAQQRAFLAPCGKHHYSGVDNSYLVIYQSRVLGPNEYEASSPDTFSHFHKTDTAFIFNNSGTLVLQYKNGDTIWSGYLPPEPYPEPWFTIDGKWAGGNIWTSNVRQMHGVYAHYPEWDCPVEIDSFEVTVQIGDERRIFFCKGPLFSPELLGVFSKMHGMDWLEVGNIYYRGIEKYSKRGYKSMTFSLLHSYSGYSYSYIDILTEFKYQQANDPVFLDSLVRAYGLPNINGMVDLNSRNGSGIYTETDCSSRTDSCFAQYYVCQGKEKELLESYRYEGNNTEYIAYTGGKKMLYVQMQKGTFDGSFTLYYSNGTRRLEGSIASLPDTADQHWSQSVYIDPTTGQEALNKKEFFHLSCPDGVWKYYDTAGNLIMTKRFSRGKRID